jgi:hypothetical protein
MPLDDFYECMIFDSIEPLGSNRSDLHAGILASVIHNVSGKTMRDDKSPMHFMPRFWEESESKPQRYEQTPEEMHAEFLKVLNFVNKANKGAVDQQN